MMTVLIDTSGINVWKFVRNNFSFRKEIDDQMIDIVLPILLIIGKTGF